jgi:thiamine biosynthesis protein ThiS
MQITANGKRHDIPAGTTIATFVESLELCANAFAVELNREIVPRGRHVETRLREGDAVEIVTFVGGG